jgi:hypothetical protein
MNPWKVLRMVLDTLAMAFLFFCATIILADVAILFWTVV